MKNSTALQMDLLIMPGQYVGYDGKNFRPVHIVKSEFQGYNGSCIPVSQLVELMEGVPENITTHSEYHNAK